MKIKSDRGFTIVELMIALSVLSVILVMSTLIMIQITSLYTKGINSSNLQNTTRNIMADLSSQIQFGGSAPFATTCTAPAPETCYADIYFAGGQPTYAFCINTTRYTYRFDRKKGTDQSRIPSQQVTPHVLWRDTMATNATCKALNISGAGTPKDRFTGLATKTKGYDVIPDQMRLTKFRIKDIGDSSYQLDIWTAYGDGDLVKTNNLTRHSTCSGGAGTAFCGVSELTDAITRRAEN